ncbi:alpha/beta fold hydrolase [Arsenicicoccus sp. oral taxon 190]|uniref:alpha/beta fold hydrolase n=1 Tax=Arsenicicoccus sp. oral taxon 190 TaxID=1658671 RepID=UPI00067D4762|nr:alpha/beta hydrolase [Arsenicicoccus sp. oral taxon 190]
MAAPLNPITRAITGVGLGLGAVAAGAAAGLTSRSRSIAPEAEDTYDLLADEEHVVVAEDGTVLHVEVDVPAEVDPSRPTVVLSHGYTLSTKAWVFVRRRLKAAGYRVVAWDQRGHGRSGVGSRDSYRIDVLAQDLRSVIEATTPEGTLALVGHSMGGMTQMGLARQYPTLVTERCVAVAFVATSSGGTGDLRVQLGDAFGRAAQRVGPYALAPLAGRQGFVDQARRVARQAEDFLTYRYSFHSPVPLSLLRYASDMIMATPVEVMQGFLRTLSQHDERTALETFAGIEALVINGADDLMTPPRHSEEIVRLLPAAEHVVVTDAGHLIMLEHPDLVSDQILAMLQRASRHERSGLKATESDERDRRDEPRRGGRVQVTDLGHRRASLSREQQRRRREQLDRTREQLDRTRAQVERSAERLSRQAQALVREAHPQRPPRPAGPAPRTAGPAPRTATPAPDRTDGTPTPSQEDP